MTETLTLPPAIAAYFLANARLDADGMAAPFAPDAVVHDEGRSHRGTAAIRAWIAEATIGNAAVATPVAVRRDGLQVAVAADVTGSFPGSPIRLTLRFTLADDAIAELEIGA